MYFFSLKKWQKHLIFVLLKKFKWSLVSVLCVHLPMFSTDHWMFSGAPGHGGWMVTDQVTTHHWLTGVELIKKVFKKKFKKSACTMHTAEFIVTKVSWYKYFHFPSKCSTRQIIANSKGRLPLKIGGLNMSFFPKASDPPPYFWNFRGTFFSGSYCKFLALKTS